MANDTVKIAGFTFTHPPKPIRVWWESQLIEHRLADGSLTVYNKGFILKGILEWGSAGWIDDDEYSNVAVMYNQSTATALFLPRPDTQPTRIFNVQFTNEFNFIPHLGDMGRNKQLYEGSIEFESSVGAITATSSSIF